MAVGRLVVKIGGEILAGDELPILAADLAALVRREAEVVVVHGGGPQATELQKRLGLEVKQVGGRRVTDAATLDVMKMVVAGKLNVDLCAALLAAGLSPVGLHGASALAVKAEKRPPRVVSGGGPDPIDFGQVGDVTGFNLALLELLLSGGFTPVVACLGADAAGKIYNINADIVGNQLAAALRADHLFLVSSRLPLLTVAEARQAIADGTVTGGMIPKLEEAIAVVTGGVGAIHILGRLAAGDLRRAAEEPGAVGTTLVSG